MTDTPVTLFKIDKTDEEIRQTVLTNVVKMFIERGLINKKSLSKILGPLLDKNNKSQDDIYLIQLDNKLDDSNELLVKILKQKLTAISKQSSINEFLSNSSNKTKNKLLIVEEINPKATQYIKTNYASTEVFSEHELMVNLVDIINVPRYEVLDKNSDLYKTFTQEFNCKKRDIPKVLTTDPLARYYRLQQMDIVRVVRPSETSGLTTYYRIAI